MPSIPLSIRFIYNGDVSNKEWDMPFDAESSAAEPPAVITIDFSCFIILVQKIVFAQLNSDEFTPTKSFLCYNNFKEHTAKT